jgi:hypothetical protein
MPRSLTHPPPSSTVARLLDSQAAARATGAIQSALPVAAPVPLAASDALAATQPADRRDSEIKRELTLSRNTDETFAQLIELYRRATGTRLSASHLARAVLVGIATCLPALQREAARLGHWKLPSNAPGHELERQTFEEHIGRAFVAGIRAMPTFQVD